MTTTTDTKTLKDENDECAEKYKCINKWIEEWQPATRVEEIEGWVGHIPLRSHNPVLLVPPPQRGKTRAVVHSFLNIARRGWLMVYAVSSHAEAASVVKHYIDFQRKHMWRNETLLLVYAGLNRFCPHYKQILQERKRLGDEYKQTKFCRKNCKLWHMKPINSINLERCRLDNINMCGIRIILTPFNYRVLKKLYPEEAGTAGKHMLVIGSREDLEKVDGVNKMEGCIRAVVMKKLVDETNRNENGTLEGKKRRSILRGPVLLVVPHELLPLVLSFAKVYARRIVIVIDEFDRILGKKVPRKLAERYQRIGKPDDWPWWNVLKSCRGEDRSGYALVIPKLIELKREEYTDENGKKRRRLVEVPLLTLVTLKLAELKEKGKLQQLVIVGSSIPLLPLPILRYLVKWMGWAKNAYTVNVYYTSLTIPEKRVRLSAAININVIKSLTQLVGRNESIMIITGSLAQAVAWVEQITKNRSIKSYVQFKRCVTSVEFEQYASNICKKQVGGEYNSTMEYCRKGRIIVLFAPVYKNMNCVIGYRVTVYRPGKMYVKLGNIYITWLGSRLTRGAMLPPTVKFLVIDTMGKAHEEREKITGIETVEVYRLLDIIQALFRINSKEDVIVITSRRNLEVVKLAVNVYNKYARELYFM